MRADEWVAGAGATKYSLSLRLVATGFYACRVFSRILIGLVAGLVAVTVMPGVAGADPQQDPPAPPTSPPAPNLNGFKPVKPSDFAGKDGSFYMFTAPGGLTCVMRRDAGEYGCSGPLPGAPDGANVVVGQQVGAPQFNTLSGPKYVGEMPGPVQALPAGSRISYRNITCGTDGTMTACVNSFDQSGFVVSPAGSFIVNESNPLLDRPKDRNPYVN
ncbi:MAG: hypothetical protein P4L86_23280 [Mycobacterium sp.]|nr:hypothetical protein [Mycobacterium sp.]